MVREDAIRWQLEAPVPDGKVTGSMWKTLILIDASLRPSTNDRNAKLGYGNATSMTGQVATEIATKRTSAGDGTSSPLTRYLLEPDNWLFRQNKGFDCVWALRLSVDHANKARSRANRSTHFIDQFNQQRYGQADDLFWVVETDVASDFSVNFAGLPYPFAGGQTGQRDALALALPRNNGHATDGTTVGQLAQVFTFYQPPPPAPAPTPTPGAQKSPVTGATAQPLPTYGGQFGPAGNFAGPGNTGAQQQGSPYSQGGGTDQAPGQNALGSNDPNVYTDPAAYAQAMSNWGQQGGTMPIKGF